MMNIWRAAEGRICKYHFSTALVEAFNRLVEFLHGQRHREAGRSR